MKTAIVLGIVLLAVLCIWALVDLLQTKNAVRRIYPLLGAFRTPLVDIGPKLRQYLFADDWEERPFNRNERGWVKGAATGKDPLQSFGSTYSLSESGNYLFENSMFPSESHELPDAYSPLVIGPDRPRPFVAGSLFNISAMSYGSLNKRAISALSIGASRAGCWHNTGEGGLSPYHQLGGGDVIFQMGTGKFGCRNEDASLNEAKFQALATKVQAVEIKLSQGAKPGKGGILPAEKVTAEIAAIRGVPVGKAVKSPNHHVEISDLSELLDFIARCKGLVEVPVGIKFCLGNPDDATALTVAMAKRDPQDLPDFITVDGGEGGTGAAPPALIDWTGLPVRQALPMMHSLLLRHGLRDRVRLIASGKAVTGAGVCVLMALGADFVNSARGFMLTLGCIQSMRCHSDSCPTGIATHEPWRMRGLVVERGASNVKNYVEAIHHEVAMVCRSLGLTDPRQIRPHHLRFVKSDGTAIPLEQHLDALMDRHGVPAIASSWAYPST